MIRALDKHLLTIPAHQELTAWRRFGVELAYFTIKEARACLFAGLFFVAVFLTPRTGLFGISRYDLLLLFALVVQSWMLWSKLETWDEVKAIGLFHILGFALEAFKVSGSIQSWSYPDFTYSEILGVPLFRRLPRGLALTEEGEALLPVLTDTFRRIAGTLERFEGGRLREMLTLGAVGTFVTGWLLPRLADFHALHPFVDLRLLTNNNRVDLAGEGLESEPLCTRQKSSPAVKGWARSGVTADSVAMRV